MSGSLNPIAPAEVSRQRRPRPTLSSKDVRVAALTAALAAGSVLVTFLLAGRGMHGALPVSLGWPVIAALYLVAEVLVVHLEIGRETHSFSLTEVPLVMGLFLGTPADLVLGHVLGAGIALAVHRRQSPRKLAFNVASFAFSTSLAAVAFGLVVDPADPLGPRAWLAAAVAALTADLVSAINVEAAIAVTTSERFAWAGPSLSGIRYSLVNACLGLVATVLVAFHPGMAWLAVVLTLALYGAYQVAVRERLKQRRLAGLQEATADVQGELAGDVEARLLARTREMSGAMGAMLVVRATDGGRTRWATMDAEGALLGGELPAGPAARSDVVPPAALVLAWQEVLRHGTAVRRTRDRAASRAEAAELMAAPIRHGDTVTGMLAVTEREGHVGGWPLEELLLLETLANHAGVTLRNRELLDGLAARAAENEWQARHDALTGLPDRAWFGRLAAAALGSATAAPAAPAGPGASAAGPASMPVVPAILVMVPDGFQEVRETLGHAHADDLLRQLSDRLRIAAGTAPLGRLDGDSFGLLVTGSTGSLAVAEALGAQLDRPFSIDGLQLALETTIGIAPADAEAPDLPALLRRAERAVVQARSGGVRIATYQADRDAHSPARLALMGDLRHAIDAHELTVHYQAKVRPDTGALLGAEALIRWNHPVRGSIPPDAFIPLAERTSLLRPLTLGVLEQAMAACQAWRRIDGRLGVAVNLSPRNLLDAQLIGDVAAALMRSGLAPEALTLEITENAVMADPARSLAVLGRLRDLRVRLSIDDYGAGHASLAWLRELPVDELKIDRSFLRDLEHGVDAQAIVRSTIDLAHDLRLSVVAEGVEDAWTLDWLARHGCEAAQGYHMGRPEPGALFLARVDGPTPAAAGGPAAGVVPDERPTSRASPLSPARGRRRRTSPAVPESAP